MWVRVNPNPLHKHVPDCVIRAICFAYDMSWYDVYDDICSVGRMDCNMPSADAVWGHYLKMRAEIKELKEIVAKNNQNGNQNRGGNR